MHPHVKTVPIIACIHLLVALPAFAQPTSREELQQHRQTEIESKQKAHTRATRFHELHKTAASQSDFDVTYYGLNLKIDPVTEQLSGQVEMRARSLANGLAVVELDLYANMVVDSVRGEAAGFSRQGNLLAINLRNPVPLHGDFQIHIYYHGRPSGGGFGGFVFDRQGTQPLIWTLSEPYFARSWWPCKDAPNDKADSVDVIVTVPNNLTVVSNGALRAQRNNGDGTTTFHWHERHPITTYLVSLAITNYATFSDWFRYSPTDSMEVRNYVYPAYLEQAKSELGDLVNMIRYFHDTFGPYPFLQEKYGVAQFGWGGGMEHQTISSQGGFSQALNVHELAHQWWGDMITNASWGDIWLNEGFASYSEALYFGHTVGTDYYHQYMSWMDHGFSGSIYRYETTSVANIFDLIVYDKGAWVLHMLRHVVGDENFFLILQRYAGDPRFKYGNATTASFQRVCEEVYGRSLSWFFAPWIYGTGRPFYRYGWSVMDSSGQVNVRLRIEQAQAAQDQLFAMPVDIVVDLPGADTTATVFVDQAVQNFNFTLPQRPLAVKLDPDNWILKYTEQISTGLDENGNPITAYALRQNYPNPFNGETRVEFLLPQPSNVEIKIFALNGALVRQLTSGSYEAGRHFVSWNGANDRGERVSSGIYVYRMETEGFKESRRLLYLK